MSSSSSAIASQPSEGLTSRKHASTNEDIKKDEKTENKAMQFPHILPIHTKETSSILSKESTEGLSFRGFGNLGRNSSVIWYTLTVSARYDIRESTTCSGELCQGSSSVSTELMKVWVSIAGSVIRSTYCGFQDKFDFIYSYTCTFIHFIMD